MSSVMMLPYLIALDLVHRTKSNDSSSLALDLCCGPGHFTRMLANYLKFEHVLGADLSEGMLRHAKNNAFRVSLDDKFSYINMDVTKMERFQNQTLDLVSFMDGVQLIPFGLPVFQIIIGLPEGREDVFVREGLPPSLFSMLLPKQGRADWNVLRLSFRFSKKRFTKPSI